MTSNRLKIGNLIYRETLWDSSIFGLNTFELLEFETMDEEKCIESVQKLINIHDNNSMIYGRFPSDNYLAKKVLIRSGFYVAEYSAIVELVRLNKKSNKIKQKIKICEGISSDFADIANIARKSFKFSRFHEDPFIDASLASKRMSIWVKDLKNQDIKLLIYRQGTELISFLLYRNNGEMVDLILAGSKEKYGYVTPYFWKSFLCYFKKKGIRKVKARISLSNIAIINIYILVGFVIKQVDADYHWMSSSHLGL